MALDEALATTVMVEKVTTLCVAERTNAKHQRRDGIPSNQPDASASPTTLIAHQDNISRQQATAHAHKSRPEEKEFCPPQQSTRHDACTSTSPSAHAAHGSGCWRPTTTAANARYEGARREAALRSRKSTSTRPAWPEVFGAAQAAIMSCKS